MKKRPSLGASAPRKITAAQQAPKSEGRETVAKENDEYRSLNLRFKRDMVRELKLASINEERSMTAIIESAVGDYLRARGGMRAFS